MSHNRTVFSNRIQHNRFFTFRRNYYEAVFGEYDKVKGSDKDPKALLLKLKEEGRPVPKMYLCCGTEDGLVTANRDFRVVVPRDLTRGSEHLEEPALRMISLHLGLVVDSDALLDEWRSQD